MTTATTGLLAGSTTCSMCLGTAEVESALVLHPKIAGSDMDALGDITTLAGPSVVEALVKDRLKIVA